MGLKALAIKQLQQAGERTSARTSAAPLLAGPRTFELVPLRQRCAGTDAGVPPETRHLIDRIARVRRWSDADRAEALAAAAVLPEPAEWRALLALVLATPLPGDDAQERSALLGGRPC